MVSQITGMIVSSSSGWIQSDGRQGRHAKLFGCMIRPEAAQVLFRDCAGRHHVVDRPL